MRRIEWIYYKGTVVPGQQLVGNALPRHLSQWMFCENVAKILQGIPFFFSIDASAIALLCQCVQIYFYAEGDVVLCKVIMCICEDALLAGYNKNTAKI